MERDSNRDKLDGKIGVLVFIFSTNNRAAMERARPQRACRATPSPTTDQKITAHACTSACCSRRYNGHIRHVVVFWTREKKCDESVVQTTAQTKADAEADQLNIDMDSTLLEAKNDQ